MNMILKFGEKTVIIFYEKLWDKIYLLHTGSL